MTTVMPTVMATTIEMRKKNGAPTKLKHSALTSLALALFFANLPTLAVQTININTVSEIVNALSDSANSSFFDTNSEGPYKGKIRAEKKPWTIVVYMSADNDLRSFAARNIKQLADVGSSEFITVLVQVDIKIASNKKITRRYEVKAGQIVHVNADDPSSQSMDSGDPETLISCCEWAFKNYPAQDYALILWNHGTGCLDPIRGRVFNPMDLFSFNPSINKFELNRTAGFIDLIDGQATQRGICWDDSTGHYLTNQKLEYALKTITQNILKGKKISIVGFDACLMCMLEVGNLLKKYADIMVGSQEVELGTGWDYSRVLEPFRRQALDKYSFARHIVDVYAQTYSAITNDYTQSAIDLSGIADLENTVHQIALLLTKALQNQYNSSVKKMLWLCHSKNYCTAFDEPSYKDLHHLFCNMQNNLNQIQLKDKGIEKEVKNSLLQHLQNGKAIIESIVINSRSGKNLNKARGVSIYLPERAIHPSYPLTNFAGSNAWHSFLQGYLISQ